VKAFKAPTQSLGDLGADIAAIIIETAAEIALVLDGDGVIQDVAFQHGDFAAELGGYSKWFGRAWTETVTDESRPKVAALLKEAESKRKSEWRQVYHKVARGDEAPLLYAVVRLDRPNRFLALGRDLRPVADLQRKLIEAQMAMERDYSRLRQIETRYRLLFQLSSEAALIVDASNHRIVEANPAAVRLFGERPKRIIGRAFPEGFDETGAERLRVLVNELRSGGRGGDLRTRLAHDGAPVLVTASLFRQDGSPMALIRIMPSTDRPESQLPSRKAKLQQLAMAAPDGLVITDSDARIISTNSAFTEMAQLSSEEQACGEPLGRWLGRAGIDVDVLIANLRQNKPLRMFSTVLRGEYGAMINVEVSAVLLPEDTTANFGFAIRDVSRRLSLKPSSSEHELPRSADQLTELIGRVPLKDVVRETTDVIERLCIEAALSLTGNNRASAAEMLGLSRQSLYVKLRRFGFADATDENESQDH